MSLNSFISLSKINKKFKETFPKPEFNVKSTSFCFPLGNRSLVGTAFDYLFRFIIERKI